MEKFKISYIYNFVIFVILITTIIFQFNFSSRLDIVKYNKYLILLGILILWCFYYFSYKIKKDYFFYIIIFFYTLLFQYIARLRYPYDANTIRSSAEELIRGGELSVYFSIYPNNYFLLHLEMYVAYLSKILNINSMIIFTILNALILVGTSYYLNKIFEIKEINKKHGQLIYFSLIILSPWTAIFYSDLLSMFFITFVSYLFISNKNYNLFIAALMFYPSYSIKPQIIFVFIVFLIVKFKKISFNIIFAFILGFFIVILINNNPKLPIDKEKSVSFSHYLMMGLNENYLGGYSPEDLEFSTSQPNSKTRMIKNLEEYTNRIKNYGLIKVLSLYGSKVVATFNDGTFTWRYDMEFSNDKFPDSIYSKVYKPGGKYYLLYEIFVQSVLLSCLLFSIFSREKEFKIILLLFMIFVMFFECRGRYLIQYIPLIICMSVMGFENVKENVKIKLFQ